MGEHVLSTVYQSPNGVNKFCYVPALNVSFAAAGTLLLLTSLNLEISQDAWISSCTPAWTRADKSPKANHGQLRSRNLCCQPAGFKGSERAIWKKLLWSKISLRLVTKWEQ